MTLQGYYNRFQPADNYDELLFRASKGLQSAELNEVQSVLSNRVQQIANVLFQDGAVVRDCDIIVDPESGDTQVAAGALYLKGAVREIGQSTGLVIPTDGTVEVGAYVTELDITEYEDPDLRDPAVGTRNYNEPGAARKQVNLVWGFSGDGGDPNQFYPVYTVVNGYLLTSVDPPVLDAAQQLVARYDRESNGNYIVRAWASPTPT